MAIKSEIKKYFFMSKKSSIFRRDPSSVLSKSFSRQFRFIIMEDFFLQFNKKLVKNGKVSSEPAAS
jgi:hypothetical protein